MQAHNRTVGTGPLGGCVQDSGNPGCLAGAQPYCC